MSNHYRSSENYRSGLRDIKARQQQPVNLRSGNYRIDDKGNPIIPNQSTQADDYSLDYFDQPADAETEVKNVYDINDYHTSENEIRRRMRQPNTRQYMHQRRDFDHSKQAHNPSPHSRRPYYEPQKLNKSWYHQLHEWVNRRQSNKSSNAALPEGRVSLFAVFTLIYLTMLVSGWQLMPFNKVNRIIVSGNEIVPSEFILNSSRISQYDEADVVMSQKPAIEKQITQENPMVESIVFERPDWRTFELRVVEHRIVGVINQSGAYQAVLNNGELFSVGNHPIISASASATVPELIGFDTLEQQHNIAIGLRQIDNDILSMMDTIYFIDDSNKPNAIEVQMKDGNIIKAITSTFYQKVQHYPEILSQLEGRTGVINFEVGAYFTPDVSNANSIKLDSD